MKKVLFLLIAGLIASGCANKKAQKKAVLDSVLSIHDKVMGTDEQLMKNKLLLDSMVKFNSTAGIKDSVYRYLEKLKLADSTMDIWMHNFDYEQKGKSEDQSIAYYQAQKKIIKSIDSQINTAVNRSNKYLVKMKMK
ncbi:MAG: hypothetical protein JWP45_1991 [Mucilaginibacter sp.]|nr:hypothetical protein [Mucilaginibacter sp.]